MEKKGMSTCIVCGKLFPYWHNKKLCSRACQETRRRQLLPRYVDREYSKTSKIKWGFKHRLKSYSTEKLKALLPKLLAKFEILTRILEERGIKEEKWEKEFHVKK